MNYGVEYQYNSETVSGIARGNIRINGGMRSELVNLERAIKQLMKKRFGEVFTVKVLDFTRLR